MKTISLPGLLFWLCFVALIAFVVGCYSEQTRALKNDVGNLKDRVNQLETRNFQREVRWGWVSRVGSRVPLLKHFFNRN